LGTSSTPGKRRSEAGLDGPDADGRDGDDTPTRREGGEKLGKECPRVVAGMPGRRRAGGDGGGK
jgi:hypothetical protein